MTGAVSDPDRKLFAEELRAMRKQRGLSRDELGKLINFSGSTIGNIESVLRAPTRAQAELLDKAFETPGTFARLEARLRGVPFSAGFRPFYPYESEARTLKYFQHTLVPGMFQTEDYARTLAKADPETTEQDIKERVDARLARQAVLTREEPAPPRIWVILDEQVVHRNIGGPTVMCAQMQRLTELARMPRINIQVIPSERVHLGLLGAFVIAETDQAPAIVYFESVLEGQTVESPDTAEATALVFDVLRMEALGASTSLGLIEEAAQRWKAQSET